MTPGNPVYFDHTQSKNEDSVTIGGYNPIENVYAYEPIPKELNAEQGKYILGAQANMWAEYFEYPSKVEYMMFPRMTALSEVLWSLKAKRDWKDFERRLPSIYKRLDEKKINYSKAYYDLKATLLPGENNEGILWKLESKNKNDKLCISSTTGTQDVFTADNPYQLKVKNNAEYIAAICKDGPVTSFVKQKFYFNKATGKKITLVTQPDKKYPGDGSPTLVNGVQNGPEPFYRVPGIFRNRFGCHDRPGKRNRSFKDHAAYAGPERKLKIYLPSQIEVSFIPFIDTTIITQHAPIESVTQPVQDENNKQVIQLASPKTCRYIRVFAKNYGIIPFGKPGARNAAWLFVDEIEIQ